MASMDISIFVRDGGEGTGLRHVILMNNHKRQKTKGIDLTLRNSKKVQI